MGRGLPDRDSNGVIVSSRHDQGDTPEASGAEILYGRIGRRQGQTDPDPHEVKAAASPKATPADARDPFLDISDKKMQEPPPRRFPSPFEIAEDYNLKKSKLLSPEYDDIQEHLIQNSPNERLLKTKQFNESVSEKYNTILKSIDYPDKR